MDRPVYPVVVSIEDSGLRLRQNVEEAVLITSPTYRELINLLLSPHPDLSTHSREEHDMALKISQGIRDGSLKFSSFEIGEVYKEPNLLERLTVDLNNMGPIYINLSQVPSKS